MSYGEAMKIVVSILPFLVLAIVSLAKRMGLATSYAPMLVTTIAVLMALGLWWFYPHVTFESILSALMASLASGTIYSLGKETKKIMSDK